MKTSAERPEECTTMEEVRRGVDATDQALMDLLATRFGYMRAAARIKPDRGHVRDEARKRAVIEAVSRRAEQDGLPKAAIAELWDGLVEASIAYEFEHWDELRS
ncbi:chorismate mutase [Altererythrobacter aurantiacus]|uniref:chorismate mutase n=1 Tax=Parapontixanthobacter aurantiacus TaxID=1463599 RepID=A0A844ZDB3_9SPHN|nr:chorismate mutase [Parapontixanthobacter aurantiacus]MXO85203.1 chorismate mutase [Parapontixanthobacter aurantiacus]